MYSLLAPAKVNLVLEVGGLRTDGYHEIATIFQSIALFDVVTVVPAAGAGAGAGEIPGAPSQGIEVVVRKGEAPAGRDNLVWRAAALLAEKIGLEHPAVTIILDKEVPAAAGLGGGSADAAAALRLLGQLWQVEDPAVLQETAQAVGADVSFFLSGYGAALGRGRGEKLLRLDLPVLWLVLANPGRQCSTKEVYGLFEAARQTKEHNGEQKGELAVVEAGKESAGSSGELPAPGRQCSRFLTALAEGGVAEAASFLYNDLAGPAGQISPEINRLLAALKAGGALGAEVSGSGATVFALTGGSKEARRLAGEVAGIAAWTWWGPTLAQAHPNLG